MPAHRNEIIDMLIRRPEKEKERKREQDHKRQQQNSEHIHSHIHPPPPKKKAEICTFYMEAINLVFLGTPLHPPSDQLLMIKKHKCHKAALDLTFKEEHHP